MADVATQAASQPAMALPPLKAADVRAALRRHFAAPSHAIVYEVAQATGFDAHRHLDAVAMSLWPSHGLSLHGIEIKVTLHDWRREIRQPDKAEQIARFCDFFWVAAPADLIPLDDLPEAWGLIAVDPAGTAKVAKRAAKRETPADGGRPFLAAMLRAADRPIDPDSVAAIVRKREAELEADFERRVQHEAVMRTQRRNVAADRWADLLAALGKADVQNDWDLNDKEIIAAVKAVLSVGAARTWMGLRALEETLGTTHAAVAAALDGMGLDRPAPLPKRRRRRS